MTPAQDIAGSGISQLARQVSNSLNLSTSPNLSFHSPPSTFRQPPTPGSVSNQANSLHAQQLAKQLKPFDTKDIKVLLLENVNEAGVDILRGQGYQVEAIKASLGEDQLIEKIRDVHVIGIRSKTKLTKKVLEEAKHLIVIGCFCIGTNQVDLQTAASQGIAVFNSPFSNSRSVAELVISEIIALARQLADRSMELHNGTWNKVSKGCWEIRGKTLGIVGYGHIGSQLSVLAESMGMSVIYYDVLTTMGLGTARQVATLDDLLAQADFVSLHVPATSETKNLIGKAEFAKMKDGSYLINNARGTVVDIPAMIEASRSGKLAGAAIDVPQRTRRQRRLLHQRPKLLDQGPCRPEEHHPHSPHRWQHRGSAIRHRCRSQHSTRPLRQRGYYTRCRQPTRSQPEKLDSRPTRLHACHLHPQERTRCAETSQRYPSPPQH